ncbi:MAG TPA: DEAD/DEAH box helicase, partial [Spirochaetia bacterium]|nr:DEAD/DEAH box helicase [Spirochaetia bacterium]
TPSGRILPAHESSEGLGLNASVVRVLEAFRDDTSSGLFDLAARSFSGGLPPQLAYWRGFASRYLGDICHTPAGTNHMDPVPAPAPADIAELILSAPPMPGAEYLTADVLAGLWTSLDEWLRRAAANAGGLEAFLEAHAPAWKQVGRVCFHLAENKKDPAYPFAFLATYAPRLSATAHVRYQPLGRALQEFAGERNRKALVHLLTPVQKASEKSDLVRGLVESGDLYHPLAWTADEAYRFLQEVPLYAESGLLVRLPDWWTRRSRPQVAVRIGSQARSLLGADAVLDFRVETVVGGAALTQAEVRQLLAGSDGLVFLKGQWVEVDHARLSEALEHWKRLEERVGPGGVSFAEGMRLLAGAPTELAEAVGPDAASWTFVDAGPWLKDVLSRLRAPEKIEAGRTAADRGAVGLSATLRHYQETGVRWLRLLAGLGLGACLADDMGLGKTLQVLALLLLLRKEKAGPSLLVLPASLLANWKAEIERFTPELRAVFLHPSFGPSAGAGARTAGPPPNIDTADVVLTSYGMLDRQPELEARTWALVVLDEAQAIKNPGARQTKAVKRLRARARIALTGTPVENRLSDLWSLFDFLCPGLLGSASRFKQFAKELEKRDGERYAPLRRLVQPYILRRLKTDRSVVADLPDKTVVPAYCGLTKVQAALYKSVVDDLADALQTKEGMKRRGLILATLLKLKQVCNHPSQLRGDDGWAPEESGKFARLREIAEEIASRQGRVLVFTQFRETTEPLASFLAGLFGRTGLVLHGQTPVKERQELVKAFQADDGPPFFVLSLKAGGVGLNLTAASHVIHFDRWWNPAVENQATDRAFRIGQKRNVLVHTFVCRGTVEEKIDQLITEKMALARDLIEGGAESTLTEMPDEELMKTVALDIERARME